MREFSIKDFERMKEAFDNANVPADDRDAVLWDRVKGQPTRLKMKEITIEKLRELGYEGDL